MTLPHVVPRRDRVGIRYTEAGHTRPRCIVCSTMHCLRPIVDPYTRAIKRQGIQRVGVPAVLTQRIRVVPAAMMRIVVTRPMTRTRCPGSRGLAHRTILHWVGVDKSARAAHWRPVRATPTPTPTPMPIPTMANEPVTSQLRVRAAPFLPMVFLLFTYRTNAPRLSTRVKPILMRRSRPTWPRQQTHGPRAAASGQSRRIVDAAPPRWLCWAVWSIFCSTTPPSRSSCRAFRVVPVTRPSTGVVRRVVRWGARGIIIAATRPRLSIGGGGDEEEEGGGR